MYLIYFKSTSGCNLLDYEDIMKLEKRSAAEMKKVLEEKNSIKYGK